MLIPQRGSIDNSSIKIYLRKNCLIRMYETIEKSHNEEGGKLIGRVSQNGSQIQVHIDSFLDSGPGIEHSATHIIPDGIYQESLFRVCESFDPNLEHLGSWHSHHCNGLQELSGGDISGYKKNVNNSNYNLDIFVAILLPKLSRNYHDYRFYIFLRNSERYYEIDSEDIEIIDGFYKLESLILQVEKNSFKRRRTQEQYLLAKEDEHHLKRIYPNIKCFIDEKKDLLFWRWEKKDYWNTQFRYEYTFNNDTSRWEGRIILMKNNQVTKEQKIVLDNFRFNKINSFNNPISKLGNNSMNFRFI